MGLLGCLRARIGQGLYRQEAIRLWGSCSVTGFSKQRVLVASHIKPWKLSANSERIDPYNSLLLIPTLDKLFDRGYLTFDTKGKILLSDKITRLDWDRVHIDESQSLRKLPSETNKFLDYHREYIFDLVEE
jgi:predicted restriction endonuclease